MPLALMETCLEDLRANLALDEVLLGMVEDQHSAGILRLWEWPHPAVILGSSSRLELEVNLAACAADNVPIARRCSGGGVVLLGPGSLNFSLILPIDHDRQMHDIKSATRTIMEHFRDQLSPWIPGIEVRGTSDLVWNGRKVSGNAQRWQRRTFLHHGTLLYDFPIEWMESYLNRPFRQPDYREDRSHGEFVTNLPMTGEALRSILPQIWNAVPTEIELPLQKVQQLVQEKYSQEEWLTRL